MNFPYIIDPTQRVVTILVAGQVRGPEIAETINAVYADVRYRRGYSWVWDGTRIAELLLETSDQQLFVALHERHVDARPRKEIIIVQRDLDWSMARIYALLMKSAAHAVHVCGSDDEARALLQPDC